MNYKERWAYDFLCARTLEEICRLFNDNGIWKWQLQEDIIVGDAIISNQNGVHLRLDEHVQPFIRGAKGDPYTSLLEIEKDSPVSKQEVDNQFLNLLNIIGALHIKEIKAYKPILKE